VAVRLDELQRPFSPKQRIMFSFFDQTHRPNRHLICL
jgi:hypothetical protein